LLNSPFGLLCARFFGGGEREVRQSPALGATLVILRYALKAEAAPSIKEDPRNLNQALE